MWVGTFRGQGNTLRSRCILEEVEAPGRQRLLQFPSASGHLSLHGNFAALEAMVDCVATGEGSRETESIQDDGRQFSAVAQAILPHLLPEAMPLQTSQYPIV